MRGKRHRLKVLPAPGVVHERSAKSTNVHDYIKAYSSPCVIVFGDISGPIHCCLFTLVFRFDQK